MKPFERDFEPTIPWSKWSDTDSMRRDALLNADVTSAHRGELLRLTRFSVGDRVRKTTVAWLRTVYVNVRPEKFAVVQKVKLCVRCRSREPQQGHVLCKGCLAG